MAIGSSKKGVIGILTGGGDVPGLNPAIRAVTFRAISEGYDVVGLRRGWRGLVNIVRDEKYDNSENFQLLTPGDCRPRRPHRWNLPPQLAHQPEPGGSR